MVETHKIVLRDLESLLRKKFGEKLVLIKYDTESLLPIGENYGSTILKVCALINIENKETELNLVAKMMPPTEFQRIIFDSTYTFKKEAYLYEELIPAYQRLECEFGVKEDDIFDIVPKFYGARFTLTTDDVVDDDAVILMQNLKVQGYYTADRHIGLDYDHAKCAIIALARFHALGMAMKYKKPEFFEILKVKSKCLKISDNVDFVESLKFFLALMENDPEMSVHYDSIKKSMTQESAVTWTAPPTEPWSTIVHSDFWINNIMFRKDSITNKIVDVKFVDFQNYLFISPLRELTFFLVTNFNAEVMENKFDDLLDCYYENFITILKRMKCDIEPFSRDKFDERMKIDAFIEFPHCPFMLKVMTTDAKDYDKVKDIKTLILNNNANPLLVERLRRCVKKFEEKRWFDKS